MASRHCARLRRWGLDTVSALPDRTATGFPWRSKRFIASGNWIRPCNSNKMTPTPINEYSSATTLKLPLEVGQQACLIMANVRYS